VLSPPVPRRHWHTRRATYEGYARDDGLFDIDAHLTDTKPEDTRLLTGMRPAGVPIHEMHVRVTIDRGFVIHAIEAVTDLMPYPGACDRIGPAYGKLVGANLLDGFRKALYDAMGGVKGCTHLTELLGYLPTAAMQTFAGMRREDEGPGKPFQLDRCHALQTDGPVVREYYPQWYRDRSKNPADPNPAGNHQRSKEPLDS
jgi:hypothetical protein